MLHVAGAALDLSVSRRKTGMRWSREGRQDVIDNTVVVVFKRTDFFKYPLVIIPQRAAGTAR